MQAGPHLCECSAVTVFHAGCRDEYIAMGLYHVAKAVSFLNNDCKLVRTLAPSSVAQLGT